MGPAGPKASASSSSSIRLESDVEDKDEPPATRQSAPCDGAAVGKAVELDAPIRDPNPLAANDDGDDKFGSCRNCAAGAAADKWPGDGPGPESADDEGGTAAAAAAEADAHADAASGCTAESSATKRPADGCGPGPGSLRLTSGCAGRIGRSIDRALWGGVGAARADRPADQAAPSKPEGQAMLYL